MKRQSWLASLFLIAVYLTGFGQEDLVRQVEEALRSRSGGGVYDFGDLLKSGGESELQQLAEQFRADGLSFYFVTVPSGSLNPDALAEAVYRDVGMTANDVLITYDGKRVYGITHALRGDPQAFDEALRAALLSFRLYRAKGLATFAGSLRDRIVQRRASEAAAGQAAAQRRTLLWSVVLSVILAVVGFIVYRRVRVRQLARQAYDERLQTAELLFQQIERKMPSHLPLFERISVDTTDEASEDATSEFLRLSNDLHRCRQRIGTTRAGVDRLVARLQKLNSKLVERPEDPSSSPAVGAIGDTR